MAITFQIITAPFFRNAFSTFESIFVGSIFAPVHKKHSLLLEEMSCLLCLINTKRQVVCRVRCSSFIQPRKDQESSKLHFTWPLKGLKMQVDGPKPGAGKINHQRKCEFHTALLYGCPAMCRLALITADPSLLFRSSQLPPPALRAFDMDRCETSSCY